MKLDKYVKRTASGRPKNSRAIEERSYPESSTLSRGILEQALSSEPERWGKSPCDKFERTKQSCS